MTKVQIISPLCKVGEVVLCKVLSKSCKGKITRIKSDKEVFVKLDNISGVTKFRLKDILILNYN
ncbi:hypothetical protein HNQ88_003006 [Aureibacter tunicatorum]|uniref:Uncharacterized protein n=1 Tax=Aureibacter tunicatorum TaxID=866807 RepID=A0AAE3XNS2_9BACT|nr:hypothetical protein [Aureibacter tunicatorum]BDD04431.1 hypothetical protein AUTU_19140 [Aureibacter tunicatorum]